MALSFVGRKKELRLPIILFFKENLAEHRDAR